MGINMVRYPKLTNIIYNYLTLLFNYSLVVQ